MSVLNSCASPTCDELAELFGCSDLLIASLVDHGFLTQGATFPQLIQEWVRFHVAVARPGPHLVMSQKIAAAVREWWPALGSAAKAEANNG